MEEHTVLIGKIQLVDKLEDLHFILNDSILLELYYNQYVLE